MNIKQLIECCENNPHGTENDEYCKHCQEYHWMAWENLDEDTEIIDDDINGEDILLQIGIDKYLWDNTERTYIIQV